MDPQVPGKREATRRASRVYHQKTEASCDYPIFTLVDGVLKCQQQTLLCRSASAARRWCDDAKSSRSRVPPRLSSNIAILWTQLMTCIPRSAQQTVQYQALATLLRTNPGAVA